MALFAEPQFRTPRRLEVVTIAVTTWCNLQCAGCGRTLGVQNGRWENRHMSKSDFSAIVANLPPTNVGVLQGVGEPTMNPEFLEICRIARRSGKFRHLMFHTNGVTRSAAYLAEIALYVDRINVSVDTFDPDVIKCTRTGTDVRKLRRALEHFAEMNIRVGINMVASRFNLFDIPATLRILNEIAAYEVRIQEFDAGESGKGALRDADRATLKHMLEELRPALPNLSIGLAEETPAEVDEALFCGALAPALTPYILPDGFLTPCCRSDNAGKLGRANLIERAYEEVWNAPQMRAFVHSFIESGDAMCAGCPKNLRKAAAPADSINDPDELVRHILEPSVNFALKLGDAAQASAFCDRLEDVAGAHPVFARCRAAISAAD